MKRATFFKKFAAILCVAALVLATAGCGKSTDEEPSLKGMRVRVVIGATSTSGDTYLNSEVVTRYLSDALEMNGKVDAIGQTRALEEITSAKADGSTVMMFHDNTYLSTLFGVLEEDKYGVDNFIIGPRFSSSRGNAFAATASAPYNNFAEMADWLVENPDQNVKIAIEAGGVSQLGYIAIYEWVRAEYGEDVSSRVKAFISGSTAEKAQAMWDGDCQVIFGDVGALEQYTDAGVDEQIGMKFIGLMTGEPLPGKNYPTFKEQGITFNGQPFAFDKDYCIYYPAGTPQSIIDEVDAALAEICASQEYQDELIKLGFESAYLSAADNAENIISKRDTLRQLIEGAPSLDELTA